MDEFNNRRNHQEPPNHGEMKNENFEGINLDRSRDEEFIGMESDISRDEEYAAEMTADDRHEMERKNERSDDVNSVYGWIGAALSIISFFMMPIILGGSGIILGFISRARGADTLGNIAIVAGAISILVTLFVIPFF
ncbi:hypothetical protein J2Z83_000778 [Virgibacillus natechei]|uniref:DUF4190 domain-containing protein n=1 Tax=Virgibacillus natechei TaxID=1216297 RepID=A0ABS4ICL4_9BACI|nr:hypothetical protein [Virgibacillus natechei]MBP1968684.1 hypothetical protein [Virgibacillus natechei]UZD11486.1 hypothetical protein OLD84_10995 [Virgibacillus natechei]